MFVLRVCPAYGIAVELAVQQQAGWKRREEVNQVAIQIRREYRGK
jgi:hypothetical protein